MYGSEYEMGVWVFSGVYIPVCMENMCLCVYIRLCTYQVCVLCRRVCDLVIYGVC